MNNINKDIIDKKEAEKKLKDFLKEEYKNKNYRKKAILKQLEDILIEAYNMGLNFRQIHRYLKEKLQYNISYDTVRKYMNNVLKVKENTNKTKSNITKNEKDTAGEKEKIKEAKKKMQENRKKSKKDKSVKDIMKEQGIEKDSNRIAGSND